MYAACEATWLEVLDDSTAATSLGEAAFESVMRSNKFELDAICNHQKENNKERLPRKRKHVASPSEKCCES